MLLIKLSTHGISGELIKIYLSTREQVLRVNDTISEPISIKIGVPRGSVLVPLLFSVYLNDKFDNCIFTYAFADDTVVLSVEDTWQIS